MQFRVRPSSKKSGNNQGSITEFHSSKSLMPAQNSLHRPMGSRIDHLEAALSTFQQMYRRDRELTNTSYLDIQKRLDRVEYKAFNAQQQLRQFNEIRQIKPIRESFSSNSTHDTSKNQIMLLKQMLLQDKEAHKENVKHQNAIIQQLSMKQLRAEQQIREMMVQHRMQYEYRLNGQGEQIREIEGLKQRKMQQQYQMIKGVIGNAQRKIYEELQRKIRNETVVKDYIQDKLAELKQQLSNQHKQTLASQTKFIRQTKQSLQSLYALITGLKKELSDQLSQTQKLAVSSIKRLSMSLDITKEKTADQIKQLSTSHIESSNEMIELRNFVTTKMEETRQFVSEFEEQTMDKLDNGSGIVQAGVSSQPHGDGERFSLFQKQINQWKSITEQKNLNVFKQISSTLKAMKLEWRKQNDQMVSQVAALNQSLKTLRKTGPSEMKKSIQAVITIFNNQFDVLAEQLETLTDMIALSKKENQKILKQQIARVKQQTLEEVKMLQNQKSKQGNLYTDKAVNRSQQNLKNFVNKEIKYLSDVLNQRVQKLQATMSQLEGSFKKNNLSTTSQLQDYSIKIKTFNDNYKQYLEEQRKEDMKKRMELEQNMRKNASNLMDIAYKKSQFLVEGLKSNIQMAQMKEKAQAAQALQTVKDQIKKQIQTTKIQFQKDLTTSVQKVTKQRENSQQVLHQAIEQSINNTKRNLSNQIGNAKLEIEEKINQMKVKQVQKEAEHQERMTDLKNTLFQMLRDQKKLTQENSLKMKKQIQDKIDVIDKREQAKELQHKQKAAADKKQLQNYVNTAITKDQLTQKQQMSKLTTAIQGKVDGHNQEVKLKLTKMQESIKKEGQENAKKDLALTTKEVQLQKNINNLKAQINNQTKSNSQKMIAITKKLNDIEASLEKQKVKQNQDKKANQEGLGKVKTDLQKSIKDITVDIETKNKSVNDKVQQINKRLIDLKAISEKQKGEEKKVGEEGLHKIKLELQKSIKDVTVDAETKNKIVNDKVEEINKKLTQIKTASDKQKTQGKKVGEDSLNQTKANLQKQIKDMTINIQNKNKLTDGKIQEINKKLAIIEANQNKGKGDQKKVSQDSLNKLKQDTQKSIKDLSAKISEIQKKDTNEEQQQAITALRKSVNKLQAMVFSQQAKNKALFDRLTEDVNKVSQNLSMLANQMRQ